MADVLNILSFCGSLRKGSYNASLMRTLPSLAPAGLSIKPATSFAGLPIYNFDDQHAGGFPALLRDIARNPGAAVALCAGPPTA